MGWSKQDLITQAFEELGLAPSTFELTAEMLSSALRKLDAMMSTWNAKGIRLGYPIPSTAGGSALDEDSCIKDAANEAVYSNLAIRLASSVGKTPSIELKVIAKEGYSALVARAAESPRVQMPRGVPAGAGHKGWRAPARPFLDGPTDDIDAGPDGELELK